MACAVVTLALCSATVGCGGSSDSVDVQGVSLDRSTLSLVVGGGTTTLVATVSPTDATDTSVTWSTSHEAVATVDNAGVVSPVAPGMTTITVTTVDGGFTATCVVTVTAGTVAVSGVSLDKSTLELLAGGPTSLLVAALTPTNATNQSVTWSSSDEDVATVSETGVVSPVATGTTTITVTTVEGSFTDTCEVTVSPDPVTAVASTTPLTGQVILTWTDPGDPGVTGIEISMTNTGGGTNLPARVVDPGEETAVLSGLSFPTAYTFTLRALGPSSTTSSDVTHERTSAHVVHIIRSTYAEGGHTWLLMSTFGSSATETHDLVIARADEPIPATYRWALWPGLSDPSDPDLMSIEWQQHVSDEWVSTGRYVYMSDMGFGGNSGQWYGWATPDPNSNTMFTAPDDMSPAFHERATFTMVPGSVPGSVRFHLASAPETALIHTFYHAQGQTSATIGARFAEDSSWFLEPVSLRDP